MGENRRCAPVRLEEEGFCVQGVGRAEKVMLRKSAQVYRHVDTLVFLPTASTHYTLSPWLWLRAERAVFLSETGELETLLGVDEPLLDVTERAPQYIHR